MPIHLNLEVYAGQSTVRCLDLHMSQAKATVETQTMSDYFKNFINKLYNFFFNFTDSLAQPFQVAVPIAWLKDSGWSKDYSIIMCQCDVLPAKTQPMQSRNSHILRGRSGKILRFCYHRKETLESNKNSTNAQAWVTIFYELSCTKELQRTAFKWLNLTHFL